MNTPPMDQPKVNTEAPNTAPKMQDPLKSEIMGSTQAPKSSAISNLYKENVIVTPDGTKIVPPNVAKAVPETITPSPQATENAKPPETQNTWIDPPKRNNISPSIQTPNTATPETPKMPETQSPKPIVTGKQIGRAHV